MIRNSHNLAHIIKGNRGEAIARTESLNPSEFVSRYGTSLKRRAYYISQGQPGRRLFGVEETSAIFFVPEEVYAALGSPKEDGVILLSIVVSEYEKHRHSTPTQ